MSETVPVRFKAELDRLLAGAAAPRLGLAVSGGGDSTALLLLAPPGSAVATVNHGLRPEAISEAEEVAEWAAARGFSHDILEWQHSGVTGNLLAEARRARYALLAEWAKALGLSHVLLGHTEDDVAETLLMRLGREAGLEGLSAMRASFVEQGVIFLRPLLTLSRDSLRDFLRAEDQPWFDDPTNDDTSYDRVRARQALALLEPLGISRSGLARSARYLAETRDSVRQMVARAAKAQLIRENPLTFDLHALLDLPLDLRRRLISAALVYVGQSIYPPRREALATLLERIAETTPQSELNLCWVICDGQNLVIRPQSALTQRHAADFLTFLSTH